MQATFLAMQRAVEGLKTQPQKVIVDGNQIPKGIIIPCEAIVGEMQAMPKLVRRVSWLKLRVIVKWQN